VAAAKTATLFYYQLNAKIPPPVIYVPEGTATCGIAIYVLKSASIFFRFSSRNIYVLESTSNPNKYL
jgi:hypothetical protein